MLKLAKALNISSKYLSDEIPASTQWLTLRRTAILKKPANGMDLPEPVMSTSSSETMLALFAGGELSQEQKDQFFEAVMRAYVACKDEAKVKFGRKNK